MRAEQRGELPWTALSGVPNSWSHSNQQNDRFCFLIWYTPACQLICRNTHPKIPPTIPAESTGTAPRAAWTARGGGRRSCCQQHRAAQPRQGWSIPWNCSGLAAAPWRCPRSSGHSSTTTAPPAQPHHLALTQTSPQLPFPCHGPRKEQICHKDSLSTELSPHKAVN